MEHAEFRRLFGANPKRTEPEVLEHRVCCPECAKYAADHAAHRPDGARRARPFLRPKPATATLGDWSERRVALAGTRSPRACWCVIACRRARYGCEHAPRRAVRGSGQARRSGTRCAHRRERQARQREDKVQHTMAKAGATHRASSLPFSIARTCKIRGIVAPHFVHADVGRRGGRSCCCRRSGFSPRIHFEEARLPGPARARGNHSVAVIGTSEAAVDQGSQLAQTLHRVGRLMPIDARSPRGKFFPLPPVCVGKPVDTGVIRGFPWRRQFERRFWVCSPVAAPRDRFSGTGKSAGPGQRPAGRTRRSRRHRLPREPERRARRQARLGRRRSTAFAPKTSPSSPTRTSPNRCSAFPACPSPATRAKAATSRARPRPQFTRVRINGMEAHEHHRRHRQLGRRQPQPPVRLQRVRVGAVQQHHRAQDRVGRSRRRLAGRHRRPAHRAAVRLRRLHHRRRGLKGAYNDLSEDVDPRAAFLVSNTFGDGKFGALFSAAYAERNLLEEGSSTVRWDAGISVRWIQRRFGIRPASRWRRSNSTIPSAPAALRPADARAGAAGPDRLAAVPAQRRQPDQPRRAVLGLQREARRELPRSDLVQPHRGAGRQAADHRSRRRDDAQRQSGLRPVRRRRHPLRVALRRARDQVLFSTRSSAEHELSDHWSLERAGRLLELGVQQSDPDHDHAGSPTRRLHVGLPRQRAACRRSTTAST